MITTHIYETEKEIRVSKLDCLVARIDKSCVSHPDVFIFWLEDLLKGLGQHVEIEGFK